MILFKEKNKAISTDIIAFCKPINNIANMESVVNEKNIITIE